MDPTMANTGGLPIDPVVSPLQENAKTIFVLHGCRALQKNHPIVARIDRMITALESAVYGDPTLAFDLAKSLVESACKAILKERGVPLTAYKTVPELLKITQDQLQVMPDSFVNDQKLQGRIKKTLNGLHATVQGLCELRNNHGYSHGRGEYETALETVQAELAARAADTVVHFLFSAHLAYPPKGATSEPNLQYDKYPHLNESIDQNYSPITILGSTFLPSEVLFNLDPEAYRDALIALQNEASESTEQ